MKLIVLFSVLSIYVKYGESLLCDLKWPRCGLLVENIVCERGETCPAEPGCENVDSDAEFLKWLLHEHNRLRNAIATGAESRGYTGPAANMMAMSYDKDLEYSAACNANRCKFEHDKCRGTVKFPQAGQNLFYATGNVSELRQAVTEWFEEIKLSTPDVIDKYPKEREDIRRFVQMIWASTTHIGCARAKKTGSDEYYLVCNYGPEGPINNMKVYKRGKACTKCPFFVSCNRKYPGLCGEIDQSKLGDGDGGSGRTVDSKRTAVLEPNENKKEELVEEKKDDKDVVVGKDIGSTSVVFGGDKEKKETTHENSEGIRVTESTNQPVEEKKDDKDVVVGKDIGSTSVGEIGGIVFGGDKEKKETTHETTNQPSISAKANENVIGPLLNTPVEVENPKIVLNLTTLLSKNNNRHSSTVKIITKGTTKNPKRPHNVTISRVNITTKATTKNLKPTHKATTAKPGSANVHLSSRCFIISIVFVLFGVWLVM